MFKGKKSLLFLIIIFLLSANLISKIVLTILERDIRKQIVVLTQQIRVLSYYNMNSIEIQKAFSRFLHKENNSLYQKLLRIKEKIFQVDCNFLKKVNFLLENWSNATQCSGVLIKHNGNFYILTCAHFISTFTDHIVAVDTISKKRYYLILEKMDKKLDLALFKIFIYSSLYAKIAEESPKVGHKIFIIGNPDRYKDIVTTGIIAKKRKDTYFLTAPIFYGNSGGAVVNSKGEVIGIIKGIRLLYEWDIDFKSKLPVFTSETFSECVSWEKIKDFLDK